MIAELGQFQAPKGTLLPENYPSSRDTDLLLMVKSEKVSPAGLV